MKINNLDINFKKFVYHKTKKVNDKLQICDTSKEYVGHELKINKFYYIEDRKKIVESTIKDLKELVKELENELEKGEEQCR